MAKHPIDRIQTTWDVLSAPPSDDEVDAEMNRIEKLDARDRARELQESGFDLAKVEADAEALRTRLLGIPAAPPLPLPPGAPFVATAVDAIAPRVRPRRRISAASGIALALVVAGLAVGVGLRALHQEPRESPIARPDRATLPTPPTPPTPSEAVGAADAAELRASAKAACDKRGWFTCEAFLDAARKLDPTGEDDPAVKALRQLIKDGLAFRSGPKPL